MSNAINKVFANKAIRKFLALNRIQSLVDHYKRETNKPCTPLISTYVLLLSLCISLLPALGVITDIPGSEGVNTPLLLTGIATILAILVRVKTGLTLVSVKEWIKNLSLTHTAFALACIPIVMLLIVDPAILKSIVDNKNSTTTAGEQVPLKSIILYVLQVSFWAGVTEEFIYRGMLVSVIRRIKLKISQSKKDIIAITISSIIFGLSHIPAWGLPMSLAIVSLGFGFGVAYIAIGEKILPLIIYHIIFDILSLLASVFSA